MTPSEVKTLFRSEMKDAVAPYLWSDADVYTYIDDAQKMFCRLTDGISDATTAEVVEIPVAADATWLDSHPSILKIRAATRDSDGAPLEVVNFEDLASRGIRLDGRKGPVRTLITGMQENKLRLASVASVVDTIRLLVFRLPLIDVTDGEGPFEVAPEHHIHLLYWVKRCALLKQDAETFDKSKAEDFEVMFRAYCAQAKAEQQRKRHKVRTVAYGGI